MRKNDLIAIGAAQYAKGNGRNKGSVTQFINWVNSTVSDFGEGFAIFVGSELFSFTGDVGSARYLAREAMIQGRKREDIRIKRITV